MVWLRFVCPNRVVQQNISQQAIESHETSRKPHETVGGGGYKYSVDRDLCQISGIYLLNSTMSGIIKIQIIFIEIVLILLL